MNNAVNHAVPASSLRWFTMPAELVEEKGIVYLREPSNADANELVLRLLDGQYAKPFVIDDGVLRRLFFSFTHVQSVMTIADPHALHIPYTRTMMAFLLFQPRPRNVLIIGLGGGSLTKFCHRHLPETRITTVEINEDVIAFSELFDLPLPDERMSIVHADAIDYLAATSDPADVILVDGFDKRGIAPAFSEVGFYQNLCARLQPHGMLVMNLTGSGDMRRGHLRLIAETFEDRVIVQEIGNDGNRVAFAFNDPEFSPNWSAIGRDAKRLALHCGLDFPIFARKLQRSYERQARSRASTVHVERLFRG
jgi:spermidine synthase